MARRGIELEAKFAPADEATLAALAARDEFPGWRIAGRHEEAQQNTYYDTADSALETNSCSLRRRLLDGGRGGVEWTFKRGRGPGRDGVWPEKDLPDKLPAKLEPRWRKPIGGGYGGIAVAGGRVYVLDRQKEPKEIERVLCLDAATGKALWAHEYPVAYGKMEYGNGPRSTPTVHGNRVYTFGALGHLHCLDAADGKVEDDLKAKIKKAKTINAVTDLMLHADTQKTLADLPEGIRDEIRDFAKARLVELGWPTKKAA